MKKMRKFKLIKKYPDCFNEVGFIIEFAEGIEEITFPYSETNELFYHLSQCLAFPEFWEEIEEYKVLSFTKIPSLGKERIYSTLRKNGLYLNDDDKTKDGQWKFNHHLEDWEIYQIQSPNGDIFTVGDRVKKYNWNS